jgi:hypothetical protein
MQKSIFNAAVCAFFPLQSRRISQSLESVQGIQTVSIAIDDAQDNLLNVGGDMRLAWKDDMALRQLYI